MSSFPIWSHITELDMLSTKLFHAMDVFFLRKDAWSPWKYGASSCLFVELRTNSLCPDTWGFVQLPPWSHAQVPPPPLFPESLVAYPLS